MKFCSQCGSNQINLSIPPGDNRERHHCGACGNIYYQNPRVICGTLPIHQGKILLCKRAIEPRHGYWTLPAGFMENGETTEEAAQRETLEEAEAQIASPDLYVMYNLPHINQVYFFYRGEVIDGAYGAGTESLEVDLFSEEQIPWDELAFPTITRTLKLYFEDLKSQHFPIRIEDIRRKNLPKSGTV